MAPTPIVPETLERKVASLPRQKIPLPSFWELGNFLGRMNTGYYHLDQTEDTFLVGRISFLLRGGWPMEIWNGFNGAGRFLNLSGIHAQLSTGSVFSLSDRDRFLVREGKKKGRVELILARGIFFLGNRRWNRIENRRIMDCGKIYKYLAFFFLIKSFLI